MSTNKIPTLLALTLPALLAVLAIPATALGVVEEKTGFEYPDQITVEAGGHSLVLNATGVGLREKTVMKVDIYTIVSYVAQGVTLGGKDPGEALCDLRQPKRLQMDLRRSFSREKLINAFIEVIEKNIKDTSSFAADMEEFKGYFTRDAQDKDVIVFSYDPAVGLTTTLNGEVTGVIENFDFVRALWTVWFGKEPASGGLKEDLLAQYRK